MTTNAYLVNTMFIGKASIISQVWKYFEQYQGNMCQSTYSISSTGEFEAGSSGSTSNWVGSLVIWYGVASPEVKKEIR